MFDVDGIETTSESAAQSILYNIKVNKQLTDYSTTAIQATPKKDGNTPKTEATIEIIPPMNGPMSSMPMSGSYFLKCTDGYGRSFTSEDIAYDASTRSIEHALDRSVGFMVDKIEVISDGRFAHPENGISYMIWFYGMDYEVPLCHIQSSEDDPLDGDMSMRPNVTVIQTYAESLFFSTIPLEMVYTDSLTPQVLITVDGMPALCLDLNCDYTFIESESLVESQSLSDDSLLTLNGVMLPNATSDVIYFGPITCSRFVLEEFFNQTAENCTVVEYNVTHENTLVNETDNTTYTETYNETLTNETCVDYIVQPDIT
jgi:hypothetical protein